MQTNHPHELCLVMVILVDIGVVLPTHVMKVTFQLIVPSGWKEFQTDFIRPFTF